MKIAITNDKLFVEDAPEEALKLIEKLTTIKKVKFKFGRGNVKPTYDGFSYEPLFDRDTGTCPTGHYPVLLGTCRKAGFEVTLEDRRVRPCEPDPNADLAWLRDYQLDAVKSALQRTRGILELATAAGKGDITVGLLRSLPDARWLILVNQAQLVRDIKARADLRADEHGHPRLDIGIYADGQHNHTNKIVVATFQAIAASIHKPEIKALLKSVEALLIDECHAAPAANFNKVTRKCVNAYWRFGESGTPLARNDGRSAITVGLLGPVICKVKAAELIDKGVLSKADIRVVQYDDSPFESDLWRNVKKRGIIENKYRNAAVVWAAKQADKPCLLFVDTVDHGKYLTKELQRSGMNAECVWANASTDSREASIKRLVRGDLDVIVCSPVFDVGVDIPSLASGILAGGGKSVIKNLQRLGRCMRRTDEKTSFQLYDFADTAHRILKDHAAVRRSIFKKEGHVITKVRAPMLVSE